MNRNEIAGIPGTLALLGAVFLTCPVTAEELEIDDFSEPPAQFRPTVTVEEGAGYLAPLEEATQRAIKELGAGGIMISPQGDPERKKPLDMAAIATVALGLLDEYPAGATPWLPKALPGEARFGSYFADGNAGPGREPGLGYMTPEWFAAMRGLLETARENGRHATYYDEAGFPSGSADTTIPEHFYRKLLRREESTVSANQPYTYDLCTGDKPLALVAFDTTTGKRVDLLALAENGKVTWTAPRGHWRVQRYFVTTAVGQAKSPDYYAAADYLDPAASRWFIENSYDRAFEGLEEYFGSTIRYTFFDDVGIYSDEKTWHPAIADRFEAITGQPATLYYPALWDDIGPDTSAARVGFFRARAELLGATFPKLVTDWAHAHGVQSTGHAPGNYDLQPTATIGDPFKFYAYTDVPLADALWGIGFARGGFKLISSVSAQRDLPLTGVEAFSVTNDANGYRRMIELFVRGFNHFVTGARVPSQPHGTHAELNAWAGRSSYLLQGGRHVADIALVFPIESLQAYYSFDAPGNSAALPAGAYAYHDADYQAVGEMLLSELHRDFTFVHPETLGSERLQVSDNRLVLQNAINNEEYRVLILPGGKVLSVAALEKIKTFFESGGAVIATSLLPSRSAEFGRDEDVRQMVADIFGDPSPDGTLPRIHQNDAGGQAVFLERPSASLIATTLDRLGIEADVTFADNPTPTTGNGVFGYIHRQKAGRDIYYFGNSSDTPVQTTVVLRGRIEKLQLWNPHDGSVTAIDGAIYRDERGEGLTEFNLQIDPVTALAVIGTRL